MGPKYQPVKQRLTFHWQYGGGGLSFHTILFEAARDEKCEWKAFYYIITILANLKSKGVLII